MPSSRELKLFSSLKQKKFREKEGKFLVEGLHIVEECLKSDFEIECIIITDQIKFENKESLHEALVKKKAPLLVLKKHQIRNLTETRNSQGIIAVVHKKINKPIDFDSARIFVALDKISDPGNLGTIIRTSYWFGTDGVIISKNSVDVYNPKVIRSTQGALFHINVYDDINLSDKLSILYDNGYGVLLFDLNANMSIGQFNYSEKNVFVFGNETDGISADILKMPFNRVKINGYSGCESLNVSVSCGIALSHWRMST